MPFTKNPQYDTHKVKRLSIGDAVRLHDSTLSDYGIRYFDCMPRTVMSNGEKITYLERRSSYNTYTGDQASYFGNLTTVTTNYIRGGFIATVDRTNMFCLALDSAVYIDGVNRLTLTAGGSTYAVAFTECIVAGVHYIVVVESGTSSKVSTINTSSWAVSTATLTNILVIGTPIFLNGRLYVIQSNTQRIYNSDISSLTTWNTSTDYIDAEMIGDTLVELGLYKNILVAFGWHGIEFFQDAAVDLGSPLLRQEAYASPIGLLQHANVPGPHNRVCYASTALFFLGVSNGITGLYKIQDFKVSKVKNQYLDKILYVQNEYSVYSINSYGRILIAILYTDDLYVFDPEEDNLAKWTVPPTYGVGDFRRLFLTSYTTAYLSGFPTQGLGKTHYVSINSSSKITVSTLEYAAESIAASVAFGDFDGDSNSLKHFKWVDALGLFNDNTVTLTFTKDPTTAPSGATVSGNDSSNGVIRFRNLGRARNLHMKVIITGTSQFSMTGLEVAYNQGTS